MLSRRALMPMLLVPVPGLAQARRGAVAPEFAGIEGWLDADQPVTMAALRGRVVLVYFWTYSCIYSRRPVAYLNRWDADYRARGLQIVGIHTPEFGFEHLRRNVADSVRSLGIQFPVGQDNASGTWRAWRAGAWPTFYLVDQDGRVVLVRLGEGHAHELEAAIRALLGLAAAGAVGRAGDDPDLSRIGSAELYFGSGHLTPQDPAQSPRAGEAAYAFGEKGPVLDEYQLDGTWARLGEALTLRSPRGGLRMRFSAAKLHLVAAAESAATLRVTVDGGAAPSVVVDRPTLYTVVDGDTYGEHLVEIAVDVPGLTLFSATFG